jgi:hypothetical protein
VISPENGVGVMVGVGVCENAIMDVIQNKMIELAIRYIKELQ